KKTLAANHDAVAAAMAAHAGWRSAFGARPGALIAEFFPLNSDGLFHAAGRFGEVDVDLHADIPARSPARATAAPEQVAEEIAKEIENGLRAGEIMDAQALQAGVAVAVVALALLLVPKHIVSLGSFLETSLGIGIADVAVGVVLKGQLAVGIFDVLGAGFLAHAQDLVIVPFAGHDSSTDTKPETRNSKSETNTKTEFSNNKTAVNTVLRLRIGCFCIRFGFRHSYFGFLLADCSRHL